MTDDLARNLRERLNSAATVAAALNLATLPRASARQAIVSCLWHVENSPSLSLKLRGDGTLSMHCFGCDERGDVLKLIAKARGLDIVAHFPEVLRVAAEIANAPSLAPVEIDAKARDEQEGVIDATYHAVWTWLLDALSPLRTVSPHVAEYLDGRKIGADAEAVGVRGLPLDGRDLVLALRSTFERADLEAAGVLRRGHDALDWPDWCVLVPWRDRYGQVVCVQRRRVDSGSPKYRSPRGRSPRAPFGVELLAEALAFLGPTAEIVICEGAFAALARRKLARLNDEAAAILGVYSASAPAAGMPLDMLAGRTVVLSLDRDKAGERAREKLVGVLEHVAGELVHERPRGAAVDSGDVLEASP